MTKGKYKRSKKLKQKMREVALKNKTYLKNFYKTGKEASRFQVGIRFGEIK